MHHWTRYCAFFLVFAIGCGNVRLVEEASPDPEPDAGESPDLPESVAVCAGGVAMDQKLAPGETVVGCNISSSISWLGVADGVAYTLTDRRVLMAHDAGSAFRRLYAGGHLERDEVAVVGRTLYFPAFLGDGQWALEAIRGDRETVDGQASEFLATGNIEVKEPLIPMDGTIYASSNIIDGGSRAGPVIAIDTASRTLTEITKEFGRLAGVSANALYYCHTDQLKRWDLMTSVSARVPSWDSSDICEAIRAVDDSSVYTLDYRAKSDGRHQILRLDMDGVRRVIHETAAAPECEVESDLPQRIGSPYGLTVHNEWLYFLQSCPGTSSHRLQRVPTQGEGDAQLIADGPFTTGAKRPVFHGDALYIAFQRGGDGAPYEGGVMRKSLPPI